MNCWGTNSDLLGLYHVHPDIRFTTWEDFAIMAMVEKGMGVSSRNGEVKRVHLTGGTLPEDVEKLALEAWKGLM